MKFIHMADMHFDSPLVLLSENSILGEQRRLEKRKIFKRIIDYIKKEKIDFLFISGDLYEHEYIRKSTIEYINDLFAEIPETKVFITPGNHDPLIKNSYYVTCKWNENVHIFGKELEKIELSSNINLYGYSFDNFYMENPYEDIKVDEGDKEKINILITHCNLDGSLKSDKPYNEISTKELVNSGFNYVATGHIHKRDIKEEGKVKIVYPGSTAAMGFDELGEHGVIVGNIDEKSKEISIEFVPFDKEEFVKKEIDIGKIYSLEELVEKVNEIEIEDNKYYEIVLKGKRRIEIDINQIARLIESNRILKIKDSSVIQYDIEEISKEETLKGIFARKILLEMKKDEITEEKKKELEKAFEIGIEVLK